MVEVWKKDLAKELLKPKLHKFPRRKIYSPNIDRIWTMDLMVVEKYSKKKIEITSISWWSWTFFQDLHGLDL